MVEFIIGLGDGEYEVGEMLEP